MPVPEVDALALLVEAPLAPALAPPPPPEPLELPRLEFEALAEPLGPDEDALELLPLLLEAEPPARAPSLKAKTDSRATEAMSDDLVMQYRRMLKKLP